MLGSLIHYLKGMRIMMFQLSGFYYKGLGPRGMLRIGAGRRQPLHSFGVKFPDTPKPLN